MIKRALWVVLLSFFPVMVMLGSGSASETIRVGIVLPLTGRDAAFGEIQKQSFQMAVEEINAAGGVKGKKVALLIEDTQGKAGQGRAAAEKLMARDNVVMLGGGYNSAVTYAVAELAVREGFPFLVNTASADRITEPASYSVSGADSDRPARDPGTEEKPGGNEAVKPAGTEGDGKGAGQGVAVIRDRFPVFRLNPPESEYKSGLEGLMSELIKPGTAVIVHEQSLFGTMGTRAFEMSCGRLGIKVLLRESYDAGTADFRNLLQKVKESNPDVIFLVSSHIDAGLLLQQAVELKLRPKIFVGAAAGIARQDFLENAGTAAEMIVAATLWHQSVSIPGAREYFNNFRNKFGKDTEYHGAEAYSAMYVIADVLKRAETFDAEGIRRALAETDMNTAFGPVKFTSYGAKVNQNRMQTYVVKWINGKLETVWPKERASAPFASPVNGGEE